MGKETRRRSLEKGNGASSTQEETTLGYLYFRGKKGVAHAGTTSSGGGLAAGDRVYGLGGKKITCNTLIERGRAEVRQASPEY